MSAELSIYDEGGWGGGRKKEDAEIGSTPAGQSSAQRDKAEAKRKRTGKHGFDTPRDAGREKRRTNTDGESRGYWLRVESEKEKLVKLTVGRVSVPQTGCKKLAKGIRAAEDTQV